MNQRILLRMRPQGIQVMKQKWRNLAFFHWEYDVSTIQRSLPPGLHVDTFEGKAYLAIAPFWLKGVRPTFFPPLPGVSHFFEINFRTYVFDDFGNPGIWFYSLDANQRLAVLLARFFYKLPYRNSVIESYKNKNIHFNCNIRDRNLSYTFGKIGPSFLAKPESLEFFLIERYLLYTVHNGNLKCARVNHKPYTLYRALAHKFSPDLFLINGFNNPSSPPDSVLFSPGVDVDVFPLKDNKEAGIKNS